MPQITIIKIVNLVKKVVGESMASKKYFNKVQDEQKNKESNYDSDEEPWRMKKKKKLTLKEKHVFLTNLYD